MRVVMVVNTVGEYSTRIDKMAWMGVQFIRPAIFTDRTAGVNMTNALPATRILGIYFVKTGPCLNHHLVKKIDHRIDYLFLRCNIADPANFERHF